MVARGGCTPFHSVIFARFARSNSEPSSRVQIRLRCLPQQKAPLFRVRLFVMVARGGFEPSTHGL